MEQSVVEETKCLQPKNVPLFFVVVKASLAPFPLEFESAARPRTFPPQRAA